MPEKCKKGEAEVSSWQKQTRGCRLGSYFNPAMFYFVIFESHMMGRISEQLPEIIPKRGHLGGHGNLGKASWKCTTRP